MVDRITKVRVEGMRTLAKANVALRPLTVMIGENGAGKSTFIEALELLRKLPGPNFMSEFTGDHGGLAALRRSGEKRITLGAEVEGDQPGHLEYSITIGESGSFPVIERESLKLLTGSSVPVGYIIERSGAVVKALEQQSGKLVEVTGVTSTQPLIGAYGVRPPHEAIGRMKTALEGIAVHLPYLVAPRWSVSLLADSPMRSPATLMLANQLERYGANLASAYQALRNNDDWKRTLEYVRLGLGDSVQDIPIQPDPGGGRVAIAVRYKEHPSPVPAVAVSDGTLAYLAHVALFRLSGGASLVAFDEPEHHLHPRLLTRVVGLYESMAEERPVVLATHSDRVLDSLGSPAQAAVLVELDEGRSATFRRPDPMALQKWLDKYAGFAEMRASGHETSFFTTPEPG